MKDYRLYVILDRNLISGKDIVDIARQLIEGGADVIQYRDKNSSEKEILANAERLSRLNSPLIINDYPEIASEVNAAGVHLGQKDMDTKNARRILGKGKIVGRSTSNLREARQAEKQGVDYIGIGPVFHTDTKEGAVPIGINVVKEVSGAIKIPVFAIGGITLDNLDSVLEAGISRIAVGSSLLCSGNIIETTRLFSERLHHESNRSGTRK